MALSCMEDGSKSFFDCDCCGAVAFEAVFAEESLPFAAALPSASAVFFYFAEISLLAVDSSFYFLGSSLPCLA